MIFDLTLKVFTHHLMCDGQVRIYFVQLEIATCNLLDPYRQRWKILRPLLNCFAWGSDSLNIQITICCSLKLKRSPNNASNICAEKWGCVCHTKTHDCQRPVVHTTWVCFTNVAFSKRFGLSPTHKQIFRSLETELLEKSIQRIFRKHCFNVCMYFLKAGVPLVGLYCVEFFILSQSNSR